MSNKDLYKDIMSGIHHSDEAIERIFNMTVDKKANKGNLFKKIASAALALAILVVGGGFGTSTILHNKKTNMPLAVIVAYAGEDKNLLFGTKSEQKLFYGIYKAPIDDQQACDEALKRFQADTTELMQALDNKPEGSSGSYAKGEFSCYSKKQNKNTALFYTLSGGFFELNLEDYSNIKTFKVNNTSKYGLLKFEYDYEHEEYFDDADVPLEELERSILNHEFILTGDELRYSQNAGYYEKGLGKYEENKGYFLSWEPADELTYAIGDNPDFDLAQIEDTITFTVEFNDGSVKTASLVLYFDSDGYMHFDQ